MVIPKLKCLGLVADLLLEAQELFSPKSDKAVLSTAHFPPNLASGENLEDVICYASTFHSALPLVPFRRARAPASTLLLCTPATNMTQETTTGPVEQKGGEHAV